jgi:very-short-patch-repair endonuclease
LGLPQAQKLADTEGVAKYHPARISRVAPQVAESSSAEKVLWNQLRTLQDDGFNFRRRVPVDGHTVDFFCQRAGLAVQIQGQGELMYEAVLERFIENHGFAIVKVDSEEVESDPEGVAESIFVACRARG